MDLTVRGTLVPSTERDGRRDEEAGPAVPAPPLSRKWRRALGVLLGVAVVLRFVAFSHLWLDEALTVNIARLPLGEIPEALRHDGAPPLFYVLLHGWMKVFGTGTLAVRALAGIFSVAVLPLVWLAAWRLGGHRVAWAATILAAASPFAIRYATEARMYSLVMVLVLLGFLACEALLGGGGRGPAAVLAVATGLALLTHYWSFYLLAVAGAAMLIVAHRGAEPRRSGARRALVAMGVGLVLFLPWLPSFLYQLRHTGTPWGRPGQVRSMFDTVTHFAGGYWDPGIMLGLVYFALLGLALFGRAVDGRRVLLELRPNRPARDIAALAFGTLAVAVLAGRIGGSAFAVRYAAVLFPFLILLVALGTEVFADPKVHRAVLAGAVVLGLWASIPNVVGERTSASRVASALERSGRPGDVVAYCPDQLGPSVSRELDADGLVQLTFPRAAGPERVDWVDYAEVTKAANTSDFAKMLLQRAGPEHDVWVVWAPGYRTYKAKCENLIEQLDMARPDNERVVKISRKYFERSGLVRFRAWSDH